MISLSPKHTENMYPTYRACSTGTFVSLGIFHGKKDREREREREGERERERNLRRVTLVTARELIVRVGASSWSFERGGR